LGKNYQKLLEYRKHNVPKRYQDNLALSPWQRSTIIFQNKVKQEKFSERSQKLVAIGFRFVKNSSENKKN